MTNLADTHQHLRDRMLGVALRAFINERFGMLGHASLCRVNTEARFVELIAQLKGENETTTLSIRRYEIQRADEGTWIILHEFDSSRTWLAVLLSELCGGHRYPLPRALARLL